MKAAQAPALAWTILLFVLLASLAWVDATTETVPDVLTLALVICGVVHAASVGLPLVVHRQLEPFTGAARLGPCLARQRLKYVGRIVRQLFLECHVALDRPEA